MSNIAVYTEQWISACGSRLIYEAMPGKEILYVIPISLILGRLPGPLPVVKAGDTGTIPYRYRAGTGMGVQRYNPSIARADSRPGAGDGSPLYFVNSWGLGWSGEM